MEIRHVSTLERAKLLKDKWNSEGTKLGVSSERVDFSSISYR